MGTNEENPMGSNPTSPAKVGWFVSRSIEIAPGAVRRSEWCRVSGPVCLKLCVPAKFEESILSYRKPC